MSNAVYELAKQLVPNFDRSGDYCQEVMLDWAKRILDERVVPPDFLMKIKWYGYKFTYEEVPVLQQLREQYKQEKYANRISKSSKKAS